MSTQPGPLAIVVPELGVTTQPDGTRKEVKIAVVRRVSGKEEGQEEDRVPLCQTGQKGVPNNNPTGDQSLRFIQSGSKHCHIRWVVK